MSIADIAKWEDHLFAVLSSERFRNMEGLGGEVPLYIYPYAPEDALEIAESRTSPSSCSPSAERGTS
jgi:hypothetical protein